MTKTYKPSKRASDALAEYNHEPCQALIALVAFAAQNPGFEPGNYANKRCWDGDVRPVQKQFRDFKKALSYAPPLTDADLIDAAGNDRLVYDATKAEWDYCAGQYFPVEFRRAALRVLERAIYISNRRWASHELASH
jgi:hypothetical protein